MQKLITICLLFTFALSANAQFGALRKAKNRLLDKVVDRTVDKAADRIAEKLAEKVIERFGDVLELEGEVDENGNPKRGSFNILQGPPEVVEPNPQVVSFRMVSQVSDSKHNGTAEVNYAFDTWETGIHTKVQGEDGASTEVKMYYDLKEKKNTMAINSDGEWQAFRTWMADYSVILDENTNDGTAMEVHPTGNTKTIEGYLCKEYDIKMESGEGTVWVTEDININLFALSRSMGVIGKRNGDTINKGSNFAFEEGFWLESTLLMNDGTSVRSTISDVRTDASINRAPFDLSGIPVSYDLTEQAGANRD